jgi:hypothetical protein
MRPTGSRPYSDLTLAVYLSPLAKGRRVLWVGEAEQGAAHLDGVASEVTSRDPKTAGEVEAGAPMPASLGLSPGCVDLAVVPDAAALGSHLSPWLDVLGHALSPEGTLVLGWPCSGTDVDPVRRHAEGLLGARFASVRFIGQAELHGQVMAELGSPPGDVVVDACLVDGSTRAPERLLAVCAPAEVALDRYVLVPVRAEPGASPTRPEAGADDPEVARLEEALADRARLLRDLQQEVERRGALVRDLVEGMGRWGAAGARGAGEAPPPAAEAAEPADTGRALERALEAEAARAEAQYHIDELEARVMALDAEAQALREANLEGTVRGLRSRVAELEEMHAQAEGRLELMRLDLEAARDRQGQLERDKAQLRDDLELEMVRSQGAQFAQRDRAERAAHRAATLEGERTRLRGELEGVRARLEDRERALDALRASSGPGGDAPAAQQELEAARREWDAVRGERDALITRLQMDLAGEERSSKEAAAQVTRLQAENQQLRASMVEASSAVDGQEVLSARLRALEEAREEDLLALRAAREILAGLPAGAEGRAAHEITAAGMESPEATGAGEPGTADLRAQLRALQERATRLQEELEHERRARRESTAATTGEGPEAQAEIQRLHGVLGDRDAELEKLRSALQGHEREAKVLRDACGDVRHELEDLLSIATETGDPSTAERIGGLLRTLGRVT